MIKDSIDSRKAYFDIDFEVKHIKTRGSQMMDIHFHDIFEIYIALTDNIKYFVGNRLYIVNRGDIFVFNNLDLHRSIVPPDVEYERMMVLFKHEYIQGMSSPETDLLECFLKRGPDFCHHNTLSNSEMLSFSALMKKASYYLGNNVYGSDIYRKTTLAEILLLVNSVYSRQKRQLCHPLKDEYNRIMPVIEYIQDNIDKDLSLDRLAAIFYLSKYHMGYLFRNATGFTINNYIINSRIIKAKELLSDGCNVTDAAFLAGFNNISHFIRTFRKFTGTTPKQYAFKSRGTM